MNKKIKAIIEFVNLHRKESIGVAVALGIAVIGIGGYAINSHYSKNNIEKSNIALADKKEDTTKTDENKELDKENQETTTESDVVVEEKEDGTLIVKDKEGKTIADSSKGDDVTKVVAKKKETGSNVAIKKDGKVEKVDKVEKGSITITGGGTVTVKPPVLTENTKPNENKPNNSTGGTESNITPPTNTENNNNPTPPVENNKPVDKPNNDNNANNKPQDKPIEPTPTPPTENKPVDKPNNDNGTSNKPQEPIKPEKPQRTWEYQSGMSSELLNLISDFRQANGLNRLNYSGAMAQATKQHCEEMAQNGATFHKDDADEWVQNVAKTHNATAQEFLNMWKASSGHRQALLDEDITEGVCAVYRDSDGDYYAVFNGNF